MIGKAATGADFKGLLAYLTSHEKRLDAEQIRFRNIVNDHDPVTEMKAVARLSSRTTKPVYHLVIAWGPDEQPLLDQQFEVGERLLQRLKLDKNQAVLVIHREPKNGVVPGRNGRHHELHICVNRVTFEGRAVSNSHDFPCVEASIAEIAGELGFSRVPGRFNGLENQNFASEGRWEKILSEEGGYSPASKIASDPVAVARLLEARKRGWPELIETFASLGVRLRLGPPPRRADLIRGLVMEDGFDERRRIKLSSLDGLANLKWGAGALAKELGQLPEALLAVAAVAPVAEPQAPDANENYRNFLIEKERIKKLRMELEPLHVAERERLYNCSNIERERMLKVARIRRNLLYGCLGSRSVIRALMNAILDNQLDIKLKAIRSQRDSELSLLRRRQASERGALPRWADWRRQQPAKLGPRKVTLATARPTAHRNRTTSTTDKQSSSR